MIAIALIGPDGSGKTTIARRLEREAGLPARYIYMGVSPDASNRMLPTSRALRAIARARGRKADAGGPPPPPGSVPAPGGSRARGVLVAAKQALRLINLLAEEWYRQAIVWYYKSRGIVVILDRHWFADYHAHDIAAGAGRSLDRRIHGFLLSRVYPQPDLVVFLDAPPEVLLARKGEGTVADLARRREDYLRAGEAIPRFMVIDASRPADEVARELGGLIRRLAARTAAGASSSAMARILVTDSHLGSAVAAIRSLSRRGHHVITASSSSTAPAPTRAMPRRCCATPRRRRMPWRPGRRCSRSSARGAWTC